MNIVILSRDQKLYSTRRLVEAAEQHGHNVRVLDHLKCNLVIEKKKPKVIYKGEEITNVHAIIPRIGASVTFYGTAVVRQFEMMHVFSAVESQALVRSRDKLRSMQILSRAGLGLPKTVFSNYSKDVDKILAEVGGTPVVIKLLEGTQGLGVVLADNDKAAKALGLGIAGVDMLQSDRGPLIIEVNSSPGLKGIEGATQKDIAGEIIKYLEKHVDH